MFSEVRKSFSSWSQVLVPAILPAGSSNMVKNQSKMIMEMFGSIFVVLVSNKV